MPSPVTDPSINLRISCSETITIINRPIEIISAAIKSIKSSTNSPQAIFYFPNPILRPFPLLFERQTSLVEHSYTALLRSTLLPRRGKITCNATWSGNEKSIDSGLVAISAELEARRGFAGGHGNSEFSMPRNDPFCRQFCLSPPLHPYPPSQFLEFNVTRGHEGRKRQIKAKKETGREGRGGVGGLKLVDWLFVESGEETRRATKWTKSKDDQ